MRSIATLAIVLACAACQPDPSEKQIATSVDQSQWQGQPQSQGQPQRDCHDFTAPVTAGGKPEQASGQACRQSDGRWRIVQNTPGLPAQDYVVPPPGETASAASNAAPPPANQPPCSNYTVPVTVGGQQQAAVVEACPQPDGGWRVTQNTPGLPQQVYDIPPPASSPYAYGYPNPADYAYPEFFPYWAGAPWFFGLAPSIVVVQRFNHFHHGFGHGFGHGFAGGFGRGSGQGFAAARGGGGGHH
jgi:surface antigen